MNALIEFLIVAVIFAALVYGAYYLCQKFKMPEFVFWIVGVIFLIGLLYFAAHLVQGGNPVFIGAPAPVR